MRQTKKDSKKKKQIAKTFLELKRKKGAEILKRLQSQASELAKREELKELQEKKQKLEAKAIRQTKATRQKEELVIQNFRKENPNISLAEFSKLVKKEYDIDIGQTEPLSKVELADAKRKLVMQQELKAQATPRRDPAAIEEEQRRRQEQELAKILETSRISLEQGQQAAERETAQKLAKFKIARTESKRKAKEAEAKVQAEKEFVKRKLPLTEQEKTSAKQEERRRSQLYKEFTAELARYEKEQSKFQTKFDNARRKYDKSLTSFQKRVRDKPEADYTESERAEANKLTKRVQDLEQLNDKVERLKRVFEVLNFNTQVTAGARSLDQLKKIEEEDAQMEGLSQIGEREVGIREVAARARRGQQQEEEIMPELVPPPIDPFAAAAPEDAALAQALVQPPANVVELQPDENIGNANALADMNPEEVAALDEEPAGQGLMRHFAIHPSHIKEVSGSYKLTGKGLKHAKMLVKYLPNRSKEIIAFSMLNAARNKLQKLDKKRRA